MTATPTTLKSFATTIGLNAAQTAQQHDVPTDFVVARSHEQLGCRTRSYLSGAQSGTFVRSGSGSGTGPFTALGLSTDCPFVERTDAEEHHQEPDHATDDGTVGCEPAPEAQVRR